MLMKYSLLSVVLCLSVFGCSNSSFQGGTGSGDATSEGGVNGNGSGGTDRGDGILVDANGNIINDPNNPNNPNAGGNGAGPGGANGAECVDGDVINLNLPPHVEDCTKQGKIYSYYSQQCTDARLSAFTCDFNTIAQKVDGLGINSSAVLDAKSKGAALVTCGEKREGNVIIAQWIHGDKTSLCNNRDPSKLIVTACFRLNPAGTSNTPPSDVLAAVEQCLVE